MSGCFLVGYDSEQRPLRSEDGGGLPDAAARNDGGARFPRLDAAVVRTDGASEPDTSEPEAGTVVLPQDGGFDGSSGDLPDAMVDAAPEGEECPDGGCACPPSGHACAGDLWLTCDEQGAIESTVNCRDELATQCRVGACDPAVGCVELPAENDTACDDGLFCTTIDRCHDGSCVGTGTPCPDNLCVDQSCDEATDSCVVEDTHPGVSCGSGLTCSAEGACISDTNCWGSCNPQCMGSEATCDLSCHSADSCNTGCVDNQTCNVDCHGTDSCSITCNGWGTDCNLDCEDSGSCAGRCAQGNCNLDCDHATQCQNTCSGAFGDCTSSCNGADSCAQECDNRADCVLTGCAGGNCNAHCEDNSRCDMNCRDSKSCKAACEWDSTCVVDCRGSDDCQVACSYTSQCVLRCDPNDPNCRFTQCFGGARRCPNGYLVCHALCPL